MFCIWIFSDIFQVIYAPKPSPTSSFKPFSLREWERAHNNIYSVLNEFSPPDFHPQHPSLLKPWEILPGKKEKKSCILPLYQWKQILIWEYLYCLYLACWAQSLAPCSHSWAAYNSSPMFLTCQRFCLLKQKFIVQTPWFLFSSLTHAGT